MSYRGSGGRLSWRREWSIRHTATDLAGLPREQKLITEHGAVRSRERHPNVEAEDALRSSIGGHP